MKRSITKAEADAISARNRASWTRSGPVVGRMAKIKEAKAPKPVPIFRGDSTALTLPWPPQVNHYFTVANGRKIKSQQARDYRTEATRIIHAMGLSIQPIGPRVRVMIDAFPPDRRARDLDNLFKGILDALTHAGVIFDDSSIDELTICRCDVVSIGQVQVMVQCV